MKSVGHTAVLILGLLATVPEAGAIVFDWDAHTWPAGSLTNSYDLDGDTINDVRFTISGTTRTGSASAFQAGFPISTNRTGLGAPNNILNGGTTGDEYSLLLYVQTGGASSGGWSNDTVNLTVTMDFLSTGSYSNGADLVNFKLFDVDLSATGSTNSPGSAPYDDYITGVNASNNTGRVGAQITGSASNVVLGTAGGTNQTVRGIGSVAGNTNLGNVTVDFGAHYLTQFQFTWGNFANATMTNPQVQFIGFHDISFRPIVPEYGVSVMSLVVCLFAVVGGGLAGASRAGSREEAGV